MPLMRFLRQIIALLLLPATFWMAVAPGVCSACFPCRTSESSGYARSCHDFSCSCHADCPNNEETSGDALLRVPSAPWPVDCPCQIRRLTSSLSINPSRIELTHSLQQHWPTNAICDPMVGVVRTVCSRKLDNPPDRRIRSELSFEVVRLLV